jgi:hypothetical protein
MTTSSVAKFMAQSPDTRLIVRKLREVVKSAFPQGQEKVGYSYAPTGHPFDTIIYILPAKDHVTLGFFYGANLPDPDHLLEGEGRRMRHVKVRTEQEARSPAIKALVRAARADATYSLRKIHRKHKTPNEK